MITPEGDLRIALTVQGRLDLERLLTQHPDWDDEEVFIELIDHQLMQGWYIIPLQQVRYQTRSLMLTNSVTYDAQGNLITTGKAYWYPQYEVEPYTTTLFKQGYLLFTQGD